jgi:hypothetical protein
LLRDDRLAGLLRRKAVPARSQPRDALALGDRDLGHSSGDVGRYTHLVRVDIGVIDRHDPAARSVGVSSGDQRDGEDCEEQRTFPLSNAAA